TTLTGNIRVRHPLESSFGGVFAGLTGCDNATGIAARKQRFYIDPSTVDRSANGTRIGRRAPQPLDFRLQLARKAGSLFGVIGKDAGQLRVTHMPGGRRVPVLPVFADLDEAIEMCNGFVFGHMLRLAFRLSGIFFNWPQYP